VLEREGERLGLREPGFEAGDDEREGLRRAISKLLLQPHQQVRRHALGRLRLNRCRPTVRAHIGRRRPEESHELLSRPVLHGRDERTKRNRIRRPAFERPPFVVPSTRQPKHLVLGPAGIGFERPGKVAIQTLELLRPKFRGQPQVRMTAATRVHKEPARPDQGDARRTLDSVAQYVDVGV